MKIKELRIKSGRTQKETAQLLGFGNVTYYGYEKGKRQPDIETLKKIADYYEVSLDYLCEHETKNGLNIGQLSKEQKQAIKLLLELNNDELYQVIGYIKGISEKQLTLEEKVIKILKEYK